MNKEQYGERMNELATQFNNFKKLLCWRSASHRIRQMAKVQAEYMGKTYDECLTHLIKMFDFKQMTT
jgi:hypothetical protein